METTVAIIIVILAAAGVSYGLYRNASGKGGCAGCDRSSCGNPHDSDDTCGGR